MSTLAFDTYEAVKKLKNASVPENQAEVQVNILTALVQNELVTKSFLTHKLTALDQSLTIKVGGMLVVAVGILAGLKYWG